MTQKIRDPGLLHDGPKVETDDGNFTLVSGHYRMDQRYHLYRRHGTKSWLLFYTVGGTGYFRFRDRAVHWAQRRQLALYRPGVEQEYGTPPDALWDFHWVHFPARPTWVPWLAWPRLQRCPGFAQLLVPSAPLGKRIVGSFEEVHRDLKIGGLWRTEMAMCAIEKILLFAAERQRSENGLPIDTRVQAALETIASRPAERYTVEGLARQANLTPSGFARLFKHQMGESVIEYVLRTRLREAARLLEHTPARVKEIAYAMGFSTPYHFSAMFKKRYGKSPRAYRERIRPRPA